MPTFLCNFILSLYKLTTALLLSSPESKLSIDTSNMLLKIIKVSISGILLPVSHLLTASLETGTFLASSSCVKLFLSLKNLIYLPILSLFILCNLLTLIKPYFFNKYPLCPTKKDIVNLHLFLLILMLEFLKQFL